MEKVASITLLFSKVCGISQIKSLQSLGALESLVISTIVLERVWVGWMVGWYRRLSIYMRIGSFYRFMKPDDDSGLQMIVRWHTSKLNSALEIRMDEQEILTVVFKKRNGST